MTSRPSRPRALVTGASRGIGRQTALVLARAGFDVAFTARTVREGEGQVPPRTSGDPAASYAVPGSLETTLAAITDCGVEALAVPMDLTSLDSVRAAAATVLDSWGRVDLLVNNAIHHLPHARLLDLDPAVLSASLAANHVHQLALVQALLPAMVATGGGTIVNMCSGSATSNPPAPPGEGGWGLAYSSSKAAFGRIAGAVNVEYGDRGVRCFNVDPGFVVTESAAARGGAKEIAERGFESAADDAAGRVIAWLATHAEADRFLGKVIWSPKLAAELATAQAG